MKRVINGTYKPPCARADVINSLKGTLGKDTSASCTRKANDIQLIQLTGEAALINEHSPIAIDLMFTSYPVE